MIFAPSLLTGFLYKRSEGDEELARDAIEAAVRTRGESFIAAHARNFDALMRLVTDAPL